MRQPSCTHKEAVLVPLHPLRSSTSPGELPSKEIESAGPNEEMLPEQIGPKPDRLVYISEAKYQRLVAEAEFADQMRATFSKLTRSEKEILGLISRGMSAKQIGYHRYIAEGTVCKHRSNLYNKLRIGKTVEAMWYAQAFDLPLAWPVELLPGWPVD
ncbi:MAG: LuxR C-terminal-related transcriptional regulator [Bacteroidota bacterium]